MSPKPLQGLLAVLIAMTGAELAQADAALCPTIPVVDDRCETWVQTYDHPEGHGSYGEDLARAIAVSGDGSRVYVAGTSRSAGTGLELWMGAYRTNDGLSLWSKRLDVGGDDTPSTILVRGDRIYVVGSSSGDFLAAAFLSTGETLWARTFDGPSKEGDAFSDAVLSPDGETLYAVGVEGYDTNFTKASVATIAMDPSDGSVLWNRFHHGPVPGYASAAAVEVAPDGSTVFVAGRVRGQGTDGADVLAMALEAGDQERLGALRWERIFHGGVGNDVAAGAALSPSGDRLYIVGSSRGSSAALFSNNMDILTLAIETSDGAVAWTRRLEGPDRADDFGVAIASAPDGSSVYVTGSVSDQTTNTDVVVASYAASTGADAWTFRYNGGGYTADRPAALALSSNGANLYVTASSMLPRISGGVQGSGVSTDHGTVATFSLAASGGTRRWTARHGSAIEANIDHPAALAVDPTGSRVFVGATYGYRVEAQVDGNYHDLATLAYLA